MAESAAVSSAPGGILEGDPHKGGRGGVAHRGTTFESGAVAKWWPLAALVVLAAALRLSTLDLQSFWYDEAYVPVHTLHASLAATLRSVEHRENTPPLWYVLIWAWSRIFGTGMLALRLPSALAGIATVAVAWGIGQQLAGRRAALATAALVATNPLLVWYSQEARAYGLFVFMAALAMWCLLRADAEPTPGRLATFAASGSPALATHYFAVFLVAPMCLWLLRPRSHAGLGTASAGGRHGTGADGAPVEGRRAAPPSGAVAAVAAIAAVGAALVPRDLRWATARLGGQVSAVLSGWPQFPVFGACREVVRAYWAKDDFVAGAALFGLNAGMLARCERRVAAAADLLIAANPVVAARWRSRGRDPLLIPFGTDAPAYLRHLTAPRCPPAFRLPPPVAGFIGRLNARTDLALLEAVAARGRSLLLVGPQDPGCDQQRFAALAGPPYVHWPAEQPAAALPGYLRLMDVGLVPYTPSRFNHASFPLKALEYLAAGRPVAATDLPALRALGTDLIHLTTPASFADQVDQLLTQPRTPHLAARCQAFAAQHTWARGSRRHPPRPHQPRTPRPPLITTAPSPP